MFVHAQKAGTPQGISAGAGWGFGGGGGGGGGGLDF